MCKLVRTLVYLPRCTYHLLQFINVQSVRLSLNSKQTYRSFSGYPKKKMVGFFGYPRKQKESATFPFRVPVNVTEISEKMGTKRSFPLSLGLTRPLNKTKIAPMATTKMSTKTRVLVLQSMLNNNSNFFSQVAVYYDAKVKYYEKEFQHSFK